MFIFSEDFYKALIIKILNKNIINKKMKILIAAGGDKDFNKFRLLEFSNITITNVDERQNKKSFLPYKWEYQDVENLRYKDKEFDFSIIHHGLHHCISPHRGLLELYRVSKIGILVFEGIDNFITKLGVLLKIGEEYELAAVKNNGYKYGGFLNTNIPNFVYRWTEKEIYKTISCLDPYAKPKLNFFYGLELPFNRLKNIKNKIPFIIALLSFPLLFIMSVLFGRSLSNRFGFLLLKPDLKKDLYPWLKLVNNKILPDKEYIDKRS